MSSRPDTAPAIFGCAGTQLSAAEKEFFADVKPAGLILFARNCQTPDQIRRLVASFRSVCGPDTLVLIDQEGGRVQRLGPPHWPVYPSGSVFGRLWQNDKAAGQEACCLNSQLMAHDLDSLGINVDCLPVLDVPVRGAHDVIGDRAYGLTADVVAALGRAACDGLLARGVLPVIKHMPGHGRARVDSHKDLPVVTTTRAELEATDFAPFKALADMPLAMTAHVVYRDIDANNPATTSATVVSQVIRTHMGFDGLLMSDDVGMQALAGDFRDRTARSLAAGCDVVLHCSGDMDEMQAVALGLSDMTADARRRLDACHALLAGASSDASFDVADITARRDRLLTGIV